MSDGSLPTSVVRFTDSRGRPVGAGVMLDGGVVTCAHVVNLALGRPPSSAEKPSGEVAFDFPALPGTRASAVVRSWAPPPSREGMSGDDLAVLDATSLEGVTPARLVSTPPVPGTGVTVFGYPESHPNGTWTRAEVWGRVGGDLLQLNAESGPAVRRGYSGSPVWAADSGRVVGIVATAAKEDSYAIPADRLRIALPEEAFPVVLHLSGTRFGSGLPLPSGFDEARPDLVIFTGDLTEHGFKEEFERGFTFLEEVARTVRLPREHVVIVPGARDVNLKLCRAYFDSEEGWGRTPTPPYWPKYGPFAEAFQQFYRGRFTFTPDEPWTLFEYPELALSVAGMNSTVPITHEDGTSGVDERQRAWFARRQEEHPGHEWHHLVVVDAGDPIAHLSSPGTGLTTPNSNRSSTHEQVDEHFGPPDFFERVLEATRVANPDAVVTPCTGYLRVSRPRSDSGVEQWPVGVAERLDRPRVDSFVEQVHRPFAAADPTVPSQIVYSGDPAPQELLDSARRQGVRLRSFVEYQGMLDLRPLVSRQSKRLVEDRVYPAELFVPQRFRQVGSEEVAVDLLGRVLGWLREDIARFVVVLGDFGRGKSFLLRQLTRALPEDNPSLSPILVELRNLEKAPTLDELLVGHLVREGVEDVNVKKLRYLISSGRLALLFDGFDELELRVGYDNAADYLTTLLQAVTDQAKVVLTSRSQHFQSTDQVLNALGRQVSALTASQVVVLEDFTDEQIREFLTRHYDGDAKRADRRFTLLGAISDLLGLSRNPRMLSFIANLDEQRLLEVQEQHGKISAAELYRELVDFWLVQEADRQDHRLGTSSLDSDERLSACTALAMRLWRTTATTAHTADLTDTVVQTLTRLTERGYSIDQAAHAVGSGSLLVRTASSGFAFVHQSVMEWLVARAAAEELSVTDVVNRRMSRLMVDFLCDLAGHEEALRWAQNVLAAADAPEAARHNATEVIGRLGARVRLVLAGMDLRGTDLTAMDLRRADLSKADLRGQLLREKDLGGADLSDADLSEVRLVGGSLVGAVLDGSRWDRAVLLGVEGAAPEEAVVNGRDAAERMLAPLGHDVRATAFSPDGELIALAREHVVELHHVRTNRPVRVWGGRRTRWIAWSPDSRLVVEVEDDGRAHVRDAVTGELLSSLSSRLRPRVSFTADSTRLISQDVEGRMLFWEARSGELLTSRPAYHDDVIVSPDGKLLATRSGVEVQIRSIDATSVWSRCRAGHGAGMAFSPSGKTLVVTQPGFITVIDTQTGEHLDGHPTGLARVRDQVFLNELTVLVSDGDSVITLSAVSGSRSAVSITGQVQHIAAAPSGTSYAVATSHGVSVYPEGAPRPTRLLTNDHHGVGSAAFSRNGQWLLTTSADGTTRIWDLVTGHVHQEYSALRTARRTAVFSPAHDRMAYATESGFDIRARGHTPIIKMAGQLVALDFSADGSRLLTASRNVVRQWDSRNGRPIGRYEAGYGSLITALTCRTRSGLFLTGHADGTAVLWRDGKTSKLPAHRGQVHAVGFAPNGQVVATASSDGTARVRDLDGRELARLEHHEDGVVDVVFSPEGRRVATASEDGTARIWSLTGEPLSVLIGHTNTVRSVAFSPDGARIATTSDDGTARIWDAGTGAELAVLVHGQRGTAVVLPDGSYKTKDDVGDRLWWAVKQVRFEVGELDPYYPEIRRLGVGDRLPGATS
ncbi:NACHT domain-containing protein [Actinosynnema sp. NPDC050436]|uniref:NACHT domain-containing protein n=1 Tax=Actinosynnema sp. NPDC050436 TaxID=3155659 RepID=UPI0033DAFC4C